MVAREGDKMQLCMKDLLLTPGALKLLCSPAVHLVTGGQAVCISGRAKQLFERHV